eukprot:1816-Heterococcus_DN1.PRE.5
MLVNSSCAGSRATSNPNFRTGGAYAASKAAASMLAQYAISNACADGTTPLRCMQPRWSRSYAAQAAEHGTRVNVIAPGLTRTDALAGMTDDQVNGFAGQLQLQARAASSEEIAKFVCFLLSEDASFITGSVEAIDGGALLKM